jgi:ABC-type transport system involved in multi-copper enzyme maturation permease subunit
VRDAAPDFRYIFRVQLNPILVRETRARFRHRGAFALLFGYAALLAAAMGWRYFTGVHEYATAHNPLFRISSLGHELFLALIWMQSLAWILIAPAITASSIAREREDGLLESMLLSPLVPRQILNGKLLSALSFIALVLLISLPIEAVCFLMGGVSPGEFFAALALHTTSAITGAMIGLACSAWSRRAGIALRSAYIGAGAWLVGSLLSFWAVAVGPALGAVPHWLVKTAGEWFAWTNPILATYAIAIPDALQTSIPASATGIFADAPWTISLTFQWLLCAVLWQLSTLALHRPLEAGDESKQNRLQAPVNFGPVAQLQSAQARQSREAMSTLAAANHDWIEIPGACRWHFSNPVLMREARGKFRMRRPPLWVALFEGLLGLVVAFYYVKTLGYALLAARSRETIWWVICFIGLFVIALCAAVMGASTFTREREGQTWNALHLSLLSPAEIVRAKLGAILLAFAVYSLPFWPLLLPCIVPEWSGDYNSKGVSIVQAVLAIFILAATAFCYALWGMWWSWRNRRTVAAIGWTLGSLLFILVFAPVFLAIASSHGGDSEAMWFFHPFVTMAFTASNENLAIGLVCVLFLLAAGCALWRTLVAALKRDGEPAQEV